MRHIRAMFAALWLVPFLQGTCAAAQSSPFDLYAATPDNSWTNPGTLLKVSPTTGEQTIVGGVGLTAHIFAMDFDPLTHGLYGVDPFNLPGTLETVDLNSGVSSAVGSVRDASGASVTLVGLAFAGNGSLYAGDWNSIGTIDRVTYVYTPLMNVPFGQRLIGMDMSPAGDLYAVYDSTSTPAQTLVRVNSSDMSVVQQLPLGGFTLGDIDFAPDGFIYASNWSYTLIRVDPSTAVQTNMGIGAVGDLSGIASAVPEPEAYAMILAGMVLLATLSRGRRR
jgi:hypothetical protein